MPSPSIGSCTREREHYDKISYRLLDVRPRRKAECDMRTNRALGRCVAVLLASAMMLASAACGIGGREAGGDAQSGVVCRHRVDTYS